MVDKGHKSTGFLVQLEEQAIKDYERWFPNLTGRGMLHHHALSLVGDAGGFAKLVSEIQRGMVDPAETTTQYVLRRHLGEVFMHLLNLSGELGMDLEALYGILRTEAEQHFGPGGHGKGLRSVDSPHPRGK